MFLAVAMDGNNQIFMLAFGVGKSESGEGWTYFLSNLRQCIGEPEGLVFVSDRAGSIRQAINTVYPGVHHALCTRHLMMNMKSRDNRTEHYKTLFWKACKAYTERDFDLRMAALRAAVPVGAQVLERDTTPERWSRAHFPGMRYNIMTSNSAESVNALSRYARRLPIVSLMDYFRSMQQDWYSKRRNNAGYHLYVYQATYNLPLLSKTDNILSILTIFVSAAKWVDFLTPFAMNKVKRRQMKSAGFTVHEIGHGLYEVCDTRRDAKVAYNNHSCSCKKWQMSGLPCSHAIAVARHLRCTDVTHLALDYFTTSNWRAIYSEVVHPAGPPETWVVPEDPPLMTVKPPVLKKRVGRFGNHDRIPSRGEDPTPRRCSRCKQSGHNRSNCHAEFPVNEGASGSRQRRRGGGSHQTQAQATQETNYGSSRHQTFDLNIDLNE